MDIDLIINTADADALAELRRLVANLRADGHLVQARVTFEAGDARQFASEATLRGADLVIAAGGDGTVNEVVNGMLPGAGRVDPEHLPRLAVVPLGTGNDLAGFLGIPTEIDDAIAAAVGGPEILVDAGLLNGRYFLNVSSAGLGAEATEEASDLAKRLLGSLAYFVTGVRKFAALRPSNARFLAGEECVFEGEFLFFAFGNGGRTGGGNWVAPRADLADGLLDLCIVRSTSHAEVLKLLPEIRAGTHLDKDGIVYHQLPRLRVEPLGELSVNVDGEAVPGSVLEYSVVPGALRVAGDSSKPAR